MDDKMKYVVVEFPDEKDDVAVVSSSWVVEDYCFWPSYVKNNQKINKMVADHSPLEISRCTKHKIKVKYSSDSIIKARDKMKKLEEQSSVLESDEEVLETQEKSNKRVSKKNYRYKDSYCNDSSDDSDFDFPPTPPTFPITLKKKSANKSPIHSQISNLSIVDQALNEPIIFDQDLALSEPIIIDQRNLQRQTMEQPKEHCFCKNMRDLIVNLEISIQEIKDDVKYLLLMYQNSKTDDGCIGQIEKCTTQHEMNEWNSSLDNPETFKHMCALLQVIGGKDVVDMTRRILSRIMTNELAILYNWTGRNNKLNFSKLSNVMKLVFAAVRKNPLTKNATQQEVETVTKVFLRNASDREGGRDRRNKVREPTSR